MCIATIDYSRITAGLQMMIGRARDGCSVRGSKICKLNAEFAGRKKKITKINNHTPAIVYYLRDINERKKNKTTVRNLIRVPFRLTLPGKYRRRLHRSAVRNPSITGPCPKVTFTVDLSTTARVTLTIRYLLTEQCQIRITMFADVITIVTIDLFKVQMSRAQWRYNWIIIMIASK